MAIIASDNLVEASNTFLENHTPSPLGTSWIVSFSTDMTVLAGSNNLKFTNGSNTNTARETTTIGTDQMIVQAEVAVNSSTSTREGGVAALMGNSSNYYAAFLRGNAATTYAVLLVKNVSGTTTTLVSSNYTVSSNAAQIPIKLIALTSSKSVYLANSSTVFISAVDTAITATNFAGVYGQNNQPRLYLFMSQSSSGGAVAAKVDTASDFIFVMS